MFCSVLCLGSGSALAEPYAVPSPPGAEPHATPELKPTPERPWSVNGQVGFATPLGFGGVELERGLAPWLSIAGGAGMGRSGPQVAAMTRLRWQRTNGALGAGFGASFGRFVAVASCFMLICGGEGDTWKRVVWGNAELLAEFQLGQRWVARGTLGWSLPLATSACSPGRDSEPGDMCVPEERPSLLPYVAVTLGWKF